MTAPLEYFGRQGSGTTYSTVYTDPAALDNHCRLLLTARLAAIIISSASLQETESELVTLCTTQRYLTNYNILIIFYRVCNTPHLASLRTVVSL